MIDRTLVRIKRFVLRGNCEFRLSADLQLAKE